MKKIINKVLILNVFIIIISLITFNSCKDAGLVDNPPPFIQFITAPAQGAVLTDNSVSFKWRGATSNYTFRYRLLFLDRDNFPTTYLDWTNFTNTTEVTFNNLDEGKFRFELVPQSTGIIIDPLVREFFIDAVQGPSLLFFKASTTINLNAVDSISIWMEDVDSLTTFSAVISFDRTRLELLNVTNGQIASQNRMAQIILPDFSNASVINNFNSRGRIDIISAFLPELSGFSNNFVTGSGKVINLVFRGKARGQSNLTLTSLNMRKPTGEPINYNFPKNAIVIVQ